MVKRLLIDATHHEEVRIAVTNGHILEEFDVETVQKKQLKSNIYLAKVIRVEPSLQAAFVEYSGGRHGFLSFSEIHPDYYRIPVGDRKTLLKEDDSDPVIDQSFAEGPFDQDAFSQSSDREEEPFSENSQDATLDLSTEVFDDSFQDEGGDEGTESLIEDTLQEEKIKTKKIRQRYKIQEVIKRRQILLVQVTKEERGNKGAALTTYLSLPGRYCVLMPNAGHRAGGVSRKISDGEDRRRLRELMKEFNVPEGMSLIVRTAGKERNKSEIKRDYEYLLRLWDEIRQKTLESNAPSLVYAEGDLVKRAIRDIYDREIEEVLVEGEEAYKTAKNFMKSLIPSHAKKVKLYKDSFQPIFRRFHVEEQIEKMHDPVQMLPSGGSIVINHTEALVAIDVNSGKATRERHIDDTAFKINLEAAAEAARQLRLRDIGGLVVIDFIDMQDTSHIHHVEKKLRDMMKSDRARIQIGRISQFGLLELSRQRLRPSLLESHSVLCHHCKGTGFLRSNESLALQILREIEGIAIAGKAESLLVLAPSGVDLYLLNQKRSGIIHIEQRFGVSIQIDRNDTLEAPFFKIMIQSEKTRLMTIVSPSLKESDKKEELQDLKHNQTVIESDQLEGEKNRSPKRANRRRRQNRKNKGVPANLESALSQDRSIDDPLNKDLSSVSLSDQKLDLNHTSENEQPQENTPETPSKEGHRLRRRKKNPFQRRQKLDQDLVVHQEDVQEKGDVQESDSVQFETESGEQAPKSAFKKRRRRHPRKKRPPEQQQGQEGDLLNGPDRQKSNQENFPQDQAPLPLHVPKTQKRTNVLKAAEDTPHSTAQNDAPQNQESNSAIRKPKGWLRRFLE